MPIKWPVSTGRELELLSQVLESDAWGGYHPFVARIESEFARFQHCEHGIAVANGTVALEVALMALGIGPGDEVIVPAISFIATAMAVSRVGAVPVFADVEPFTFNLDPDCAARAVSPRTRAIIPVHFGGQLANMDRLCELARDQRLILIEDAAHGHGSEWRGRRAGSLGQIACFSFQNSKVMTSGEGGMITTNDATLAERVRSIVNIGRAAGHGWFHHFSVATNARMTAFQAAVLIAQLERLPDQIALRRRNLDALMARAGDLPGIHWQEAPPEANANSLYLVLGRVEPGAGFSRDELLREFAEHGLTGCTFYPHTLYQNLMYPESPCRIEPCPDAEAQIRDAFWIGHRNLMEPSGDGAELSRAVISAIEALVGRPAAGR